MTTARALPIEEQIKTKKAQLAVARFQLKQCQPQHRDMVLRRIDGLLDDLAKLMRAT
jgi:hypothetical protein